jgi:hypothetical protein
MRVVCPTSNAIEVLTETARSCVLPQPATA